jgi:hypothetical protein
MIMNIVCSKFSAKLKKEFSFLKVSSYCIIIDVSSKHLNCYEKFKILENKHNRDRTIKYCT